MLVELILAGWFFGFFAVAGVALRHNESPVVRRGYLAVFFLALSIPTMTGLTAIPFASWHLFPQPAPDEMTFYEVRLVDGNDREVTYDARAAPPMRSPSIRWLGGAMVTRHDPERRAAFAGHLLEEAREYRQRLHRRGSVGPAVPFPPHNLDYRWNESRLDRFGRFVGLRVYRVTVTFGPESEEITERSETLALVCRETGASETREVSVTCRS